ncbi:TetR/AcrR family transcriptional regulator [Isoalcanivorax beigongshangi]|uniref:TetR/AcrR family transcriptional regulator n=1 Tax=Isoalcanivorax beigongshangi TaxID=3238810 RepID=A0ABV4AHG8_9GAMM
MSRSEPARHGARHRARLAQPRTKPATVRRDELMNAAEALFLAQGVDATPVSDIVERADVAKGTFYHYFPSKTALLQALGERYAARFVAGVDEAVARCAADDWPGRLRTWVEATLAQYLDSYPLHDVVYVNHHHHRVSAEKTAIVTSLRTVLEAGQAAGAWQLQHPAALALMLFGGIHGAADHLIATNSREPGFIAEIVTGCLHAVGAGH